MQWKLEATEYEIRLKKHPHRIEIDDLDKMICHTPTSVVCPLVSQCTDRIWFVGH